MTNTTDTTEAINNSLLFMCDNKNKKEFLINRLALGMAMPCFAFTKTLNGAAFKKTLVAIANYDRHKDCFISDDGLMYAKVVYVGFIGECNLKHNLAPLVFTTSQTVDMATSVARSAYNESLDDFDMLQHASASTVVIKPMLADNKTSIASLDSFKSFMAVYHNLPLAIRSINNFDNNELEWFYYSTIGTELANLSVAQLLTNGRIINIVEACDKLSCSIEELEQSIQGTVTDKAKRIWSVRDASDWVNCNFVLVYLN